MLTETDLKEIAACKGGMIISAKDYSVTTLKELASFAGGDGGMLIIKRANKLTPADLQNIAEIGDGKVVFDLTD